MPMKGKPMYLVSPGTMAAQVQNRSALPDAPQVDAVEPTHRVNDALARVLAVTGRWQLTTARRLAHRPRPSTAGC